MPTCSYWYPLPTQYNTVQELMLLSNICLHPFTPATRIFTLVWCGNEGIIWQIQLCFPPSTLCGVFNIQEGMSGHLSNHYIFRGLVCLGRLYWSLSRRSEEVAFPALMSILAHALGIKCSPPVLDLKWSARVRHS